MASIAAGLAAERIAVVRFEFPYMQRRRALGRRGVPDPMPALEAAFVAVAGAFRKRARLFVGGKSMGARVAAHVAGGLGARGVVALGYPFHPPNRPDKLRIEALRALEVPCLVVQGTRDPFGTREEVLSYELPAHVRLSWVDDGDHSLVPRRASGRTEAQNLAEAVRASARFLLAT